MPQLQVNIIVTTPPDVDGATTRLRKSVDLLSQLTPSQQQALATIFSAIGTYLQSRYPGVTIEGWNYQA